MTRNVKAVRYKNHFPRVIHQIGLFTSFETAPHNPYCKFVCLNYLHKLFDFTRVAILVVFMISDTIFTQANKTPSEGAPVEEHINTYEKYD